MKRKAIFFTFLMFSMNAFTTEQIPDLLIIGKDTVFLKTFPLEQLEMKSRPFGFWTKEKSFASTACWRSYKAIWRIIDNKLFLERIVECHNRPGEENIIELFERNGIKFQEKEGRIFADWCTLDLYRQTFSSRGTRWERDKIFLYDRPLRRRNAREIILQIENGVITINRLQRPAAN